MKFDQKGYTEVVTLSLIFGLIGSLFITGVFIWHEIDKSNVIEIRSTEKEDMLVEKLIDKKISEGADRRGIRDEVESKFCNTVEDCVIIEGIGACPSKKAFNKDAKWAHEEYEEDSKTYYCTMDIKRPKKSELVCEDNQCGIKYTEL